MSARPGTGAPNPLANFTKLKKLGEGGFGKVFLVQDRRDHQSYVMKEVDLSKLDAKGRKEATKECAFLARMSHPNIISYKEWFEVAGSANPQAGPWNAAAWQQKGGRVPAAAQPAMLYIIMSYADGGDLEAKIKAQQKLSGGGGRIVPFPEQQIIDWFIQTALAIKHIHDRKILHRDIKTQNIFLTKLNLVKLGDFGIARDLNSTMAKAMTQIGTPFYLSPEICAEKPYDSKSDIWALGVVLYEMMCLKHPFQGQTMKQLISNIVNASYPPPPPIYSRPLMDLVAFLLQKNPKNRPTINQLLRFPFIQQHIGRFLNQHKIQEEFSHTILHGNLGLVGGMPAPQLPSKDQAQLRAQQLHAQEEAARMKEAQQAAQQQQQQQQQQLQAQQQQVARERELAKQQAIARAKALAVEQAERARQAYLRQQAEARARAEAVEQARMKAARDARAKELAAREAAQRERELREAKEAQNRKEAQRRADERARLAAQEKERERAEWREQQREREREARMSPQKEVGGGGNKRASAGGGDWDGHVLVPKKKGSPSPAQRPPWVGIVEPEEAARAEEEERRREEEMAAARRAEDRRIEERERERMRIQEEKERERRLRKEQEEREYEQRQQQQRHHDRSVSEHHAPTLVRPMQQQQQPSSSRDQQQQQRRDPYQRDAPPSSRGMARAASEAQLPSGLDSRQDKLAKQRAHEEELARARKEYFEERKQLEQRQKAMLAGGGGGANPSESRDEKMRRSPPPGMPAQQQPSSSQQQQPSSREPSRRDAPPQDQRRSVDQKPVSAEDHEAQLARARKENFEERKALEAKRKAMMAGEQASEPVVDRNERPLGGGMKKAASEAVFDRPTSSAGRKANNDTPPPSKPLARKSSSNSSASPSRPVPSSKPVVVAAPVTSEPVAAPAPVSYRRGEKYGREKEAAMAEKEAELARMRIEYFEERKALAARKQQALEEAGLAVPKAAQAKETSSSAAPQPATNVPSSTPSVASTSTSKPSTSSSSTVAAKKLTHSEQLAHDRAAFFAAQRAGASKASSAAQTDTVLSPPKSSAAAISSQHSSPSQEFNVVQHPPITSPPMSPEGVNTTNETQSPTPPSVIEGEPSPEEVVDPVLVAREAESSIDELASNTNSCQQMVELMETMREIMLPLPPGARLDVDEDGDDANSNLIDDAEDDQPYIPPPTETNTESDTGRSEEGDNSGDTISPDSGLDDSEIQPTNESELNAENEFETFREEELREACQAALASSAEHDLRELKLERLTNQQQQQSEQDEMEGEPEVDQDPSLEDDEVDHLPTSKVSSSSSSQPPSNNSALYNSSRTLPPNRFPPTKSSPTPPVPEDDSATTAAAASSSSQSTVQAPSSLESHSYDGSVDTSMSSSLADTDPMSYKVESLRLFLSEKLGDETLLDIYRLLRKSMQQTGGIQSMTTIHTDTTPNTTLLHGLPPNSARDSSGSSSSRRGSIASLVVNNLNIRDLLNNSGLLTPDKTKYISLIQQLIKAEHQLYGQL